MKILHQVWKQVIWVWNKCQGYEKSAWWYETNDKCSETNTHLKDAHIVLLTDFFRTVYVWCGFVLYLSGRYLCGVGFFCTICTVFKSIHIQLEPHSTFFTTKNESKFVLCATGCTPRMEVFRTIETFFVPQSDSIPHFMFQGSHMSQEGLKQVSHPLIFEYWARDSDLGFRSQRRGVA